MRPTLSERQQNARCGAAGRTDLVPDSFQHAKRPRLSASDCHAHGGGVCSRGCWSPGGMVACRTVPRRPVAAARPAASIRLSSERLWCGRGSCHDRGCRYIRCFVVVAKPAARRAGTWDVTLLWQGLVLMNRRQVGLTGLSVTELGFGGAAIGGLFKPSSADVARAAVDAAWDAGIRYFDTAPHYGLGMSERRLGEALRGRPREEY